MSSNEVSLCAGPGHWHSYKPQPGKIYFHPLAERQNGQYQAPWTTGEHSLAWPREKRMLSLVSSRKRRVLHEVNATAGGFFISRAWCFHIRTQFSQINVSLEVWIIFTFTYHKGSRRLLRS